MGTSNKQYQKEISKISRLYGIYDSFDGFEEFVCKYLLQPTEDFDAETLFENIKKYVGDDNKYNRIMLSKIYTIMSNSEEEDNGIMVSNLDSLLDYAKKNKVKNKVNNNTNKIIAKLYDHIHLVLLQEKDYKTNFDNNIEEVKKDLNTKIKEQINPLFERAEGIENRIKSSEKNYITILGIFASFVVTFVGGLSFSSAVLSGISQVSIYRLIVVILLLGLVLISISFMLFQFIARVISDANVISLDRIYMTAIKVIVVLFFICFLFWMFDGRKWKNRLNDMIDKKYNSIGTLTDVLIDHYDRDVATISIIE